MKGRVLLLGRLLNDIKIMRDVGIGDFSDFFILSINDTQFALSFLAKVDETLMRFSKLI